MAESNSPIRIHSFTLTETLASEHIYGRELHDALFSEGIRFVDDWRNADVVHLLEVNFYTRATLSAFKFPKLLRILRSDVPVVISTDDLYFTGDPSLTARPWLYPLNRRTQRWLFEQSDAIIAISESVRSALAPALSTPELHVVHHGVGDRYFEETTNTDDPYVLHVSLASKRKNPEAIVEVAERLDSRFVIAGGGWEEYVPNRLRGQDVEVTGYVPEDELVDLYKDASVFYFPTRHEGFGLPLLEAMAAGNAVVASNVYSVPEVVGDTAILHDPHDVDAHLGALWRLLEDDERREELGTEARNRAREFTWAKSAEETIDVYRSVIDSQ